MLNYFQIRWNPSKNM